MIVRHLTLFVMIGCSVQEARGGVGRGEGVATRAQHARRTLEHPVAHVSGAGEYRGPRWYSFDTSDESASDLKDDDGSSASMDTDFSGSSRHTESASSVETKEGRQKTRAYRECVVCPLDMIRKYKNQGLNWICGQYQRARRSFKSVCMMRYRNCQDGTMFVKIADHKCKTDSYHGRHWFYLYKV